MVDVAARHVEREQLRSQISQPAPRGNKRRAVSAPFELEEARYREKCLRCLRCRQGRRVVGPHPHTGMFDEVPSGEPSSASIAVGIKPMARHMEGSPILLQQGIIDLGDRY